MTRVALLADERICVLRQTVSENPLGEQEVANHESVWRENGVTGIRVMTMDRDGTTLYAGTDDGRLVRWQLNEKGEVSKREVVRAFADQRGVTALAMVLGDVSLAVGDSRGELSTWFSVRTEGTRTLRLIHRLQPHTTAIREILPSGRNKSILSLDDAGGVDFDHMTSERHLLSIVPERAADRRCLGRPRRRPAGVGFFRRIDGLADRGRLPGDQLQDPFRQGTLRGLRRARLCVADDRRRGIRAEVQPRAAAVRHVQGHVLRHVVCGAAGLVRSSIHQLLCCAGLSQND